MIRAVLDTNTLASGALSTTGTLAEIIAAWYTRRFELVASPIILEELTRTLDKPYFRDRLDGQARANFLARVAHTATTPIGVHVSGVASHPEDDVILATAISGRVDYLVTRRPCPPEAWYVPGHLHPLPNNVPGRAKSDTHRRREIGQP